MSITNDIINHTEYIRKLRSAGGQAAQEAASDSPAVDVGLFDYDEWVANRDYKKGELFTYNGDVGFARQAVTSQAHFPPFSVGTEALYGARPRMRPDGTYPYVYNMKVTVGMCVWSTDDGKLYECIQAADPLLRDPSAVPAHFTEVI